MALLIVVKNSKLVNNKVVCLKMKISTRESMVKVE